MRRFRAVVEHEHRVNSFLAVHLEADYGGVLHARLLQERSLDVFGKDVEALRRDDHLLLAALDQEAARSVEFADVARVEPAVPERSVGLGCARRRSCPPGR